MTTVSWKHFLDAERAKQILAKNSAQIQIDTFKAHTHRRQFSGGINVAITNTKNLKFRPSENEK